MTIDRKVTMRAGSIDRGVDGVTPARAGGQITRRGPSQADAARQVSGNAAVNKPADDTKVARTRAALRQAFFQLLLARHYEDVKVSDIAQRAGVGRSTFYEHFRSKDDLLLASLRHLLEVVAQCASDQADPARLQLVLEHFWQNRRLARVTLGGPSRPRIARLLAELIEDRLPEQRSAPAATRRVVARQLAEGMLGLLVAWLTGELSCDARVVAETLRRAA
jgi:AcrR family transcriptional regulator